MNFPLKLISICILSLSIFITVEGTNWFTTSFKKMSIYSLLNHDNEQSLHVYDRNMVRLGNLNSRKRDFVRLGDLRPWVGGAFISIEDRSFFDHSGISITSIVRSAIKNLLAGKVVQGGSTITQQLARTMLGSFDRTLERKIKEVVLAINLEERFSKKRILESYLIQYTLVQVITG